MAGAIDLPLSHVFRRKDARPIDEAALRGLVASIAELGIIHPLRVRPARRHVDGALTDAYEVTAGAHRLKAALKLNLETVPCIVVEDDDLHAELVMIDENLMRAELSPAERAKQTARRKAIYLELHPETAHGTNQHTRGDENFSSPSFADATAEATGKTARVVQLHAERGEKVALDVLERVAGTHLDTGAYLDQLKKLPPEDQRARVDRALSAKPAKIADEPLNDFEARERQVAALMAAWNKASPEARADFLARIDQPPVMDRKFG
jgi:ParB family chromosome partitioning protein